MSGVRFARFLTSLVPAVILLALSFGIVIFVGSRLGGLTGLLLGILAGGCMALSVLLAYWNVVDWSNLRIIRRTKSSGPADWLDGQVVAVDGFVRVDGEPMASPFSGIPCAALTYVVSGHRYSSTRQGSKRVLMAQGYHLIKSHIDRAGQRLRLCALPGFSDELRRAENGGTWGQQALQVLGNPNGTMSHGREGQILSGLLEARHSLTEEIRCDYVTGFTSSQPDGLTVVEEVLPVDREVCIIGTYDRQLGGLSARRPRIGPNLIAYAGSADEVLARVGKELATFTRVALVLVGIGVAIVAYALVRPA